jgi:recombination protein RecA
MKNPHVEICADFISFSQKNLLSLTLKINNMGKIKEIKSDFQTILSDLEKKYGLGRISLKDLVIVSTGSLQLNQAMGIGGTALGKIVEIFGEESSGKSSIALHQIAEYQKAFPEKRVALMDFEHSFDKKYATSLGVDVDKLLIYQAENQESGYDMVLGLIEKDLVSCIVIDSQTAAAPKAIIDGDMSDATIGLQARNNSKFCLKVKGLLSIHNVSLFIISQTRNTIGGMGDPNITTGGKAIKFYADVRWKVWKQNDKVNELNKTTIDIVKSKLSNPFGQAKLSIEWGLGFDTIGEIIAYAEEFNIIKKSGSWYSYGDVQLVQGTEKVKLLLKDNVELLEELTQKVMCKLMDADIPIEEPVINEEL